VANRARRWAIFVHGCFWHQHPKCQRATMPKRNAAFWRAKFAANRARDARVRRQLRGRGYFVLTVWECEAERPSSLGRRLRALADYNLGKRDS
jgi:DNA mismatch endonuclease (patch repair protein)